MRPLLAYGQDGSDKTIGDVLLPKTRQSQSARFRYRNDFLALMPSSELFWSLIRRRRYQRLLLTCFDHLKSITQRIPTARANLAPINVALWASIQSYLFRDRQLYCFQQIYAQVPYLTPHQSDGFPSEPKARVLTILLPYVAPRPCGPNRDTFSV